MSETKGKVYLLARGRETHEFLPIWTGPLADKPANQSTMRERVAVEALGGMLASPGESAIYREELVKDAIRYADRLIELLDCTNPTKDDKPPWTCSPTTHETVDWRKTPVSALNGVPPSIIAHIEACGIKTCGDLHRETTIGFAYLTKEANSVLSYALHKYLESRGVKP